MSMNYVQRLEHRGREAVADCLIRDLMVPNIYFDANWPNAQLQADVLAIDRAGTGDVHVVQPWWDRMAFAWSGVNTGGLKTRSF